MNARSVCSAILLTAAAGVGPAGAQWWCEIDPSLCGGGGPIRVRVETDQNSYFVGDPIAYTVVALNSSPDPVTLRFSTSQQADFFVDGVYSPDDVAFQILTSRTVPGLGSTSWGFAHPWDEYELSPGRHRVVGSVIGVGRSQPEWFEVLVPPPVERDVFLDFEHYPDGTPTLGEGGISHGLWDSAFLRSGVRFGSEGGGLNLRATPMGFISTRRQGSSPQGFNITADFDMPVYGVSAEVGSAGGESVTMVAYDAAGEVLGSVTSEPVLDYPNAVGRLSFDSDTPIAAVQWTPSRIDAAVTVDDLFLNVSRSELLGDFNDDGVTDAADYVSWRSSRDDTVPNGFGADADHSGVIDDADFNIWQQNYGNRIGVVAVPEPATVGFVVLPGLMLGAASARRQTHKQRQA